MNSAPSGRSSGHIPLWLLASLCIGLSACGGSGGDTGNATTTARADDSMAQESVPAPSAWLNAQSLEAAEKEARATSPASAPLDSLAPGQIAAWDDYASGAVTRKSTTVQIPVYRFYNTQTTAHFYTTSETEKANVLATMPQFHLEGTAFHGASASSPGLSPVYRFYNYQTGVHFYTISESEKSSVLANLPQFVLEGPAYYASQVSGQGLTPLYRFYVPAKGFHFYTASSTERDSIIANLASTYSYEGVGYYVLSATWTADRLPHTGIAADQCYGMTAVSHSDAFGPCTSTLPSLVVPLTTQQDSTRATHNPMSYSSVRAGFLNLPMPVTSCVRDDVTGLYWEGKTDDGGLRDKDNLYTNQDNGAPTDASGYVAAVNATSLCGFTDWRMPTALELMSLNHYGRTDGAPYVDPTWFPNTLPAYYWTGESRDATKKWRVGHDAERFDDFSDKATSSWPVRLVRGSMANVSGGRFTYSTLSYGGDGANNVVNDKLTGLQWRRCLEGQTWTGATCVGAAVTFSHRDALTYNESAGTPAGWRLPNVKEGSSLIIRDDFTAPRIDSTAFPDASSHAFWTSTAAVGSALTNAYSISATNGWIAIENRTSVSLAIRLVR